MSAMNGINRLIQVTQAKVQDANDEAREGADQARKIMDKKKVIRHALRDLQADASDGTIDYGKMKSNYIEAQGADPNLKGAWKHNAGEYKYWYVDGKFKTDGDTDGAKQNKATVDGLVASYEGAIEDLDSQEKLGNFEIQDLMSRYNQNEQLSGSVFKKKDDAGNAIIGKI